MALLTPLVAGTWWLWGAGRLVWQERTTSFGEDPISPLPIEGGEWVVQPWLPAVLVWGAETLAGEAGLLLLGATVTAVTCWLLLLVAWRHAPGVPGAIAVLLVLPLLWPPIVQGQLFAVLLFALLQWLLWSGRWWWCPLVLVVWANVHGSVPIGVAYCGVAALGAFPARPRTREGAAGEPAHPGPDLAGWWGLPLRALWLAACAGAVFVSPLHVRIVDYVSDIEGVAGLSRLTTAWTALDLGSPAGAWVVLLAGIGILALLRTPAYRWWLLALLPLLALSVDARRHLVWLAVALVPVLAWLLQLAWARRRWPAVPRAPLALGALGVAALVVFVALLPGTPFAERVTVEAAPPELVKSVRPGETGLVALEWANYVNVRAGARVLLDARLERYEDRHLLAYLRSTGRRGDIPWALVTCDERSNPSVDFVMVRHATQPALQRRLERGVARNDGHVFTFSEREAVEEGAVFSVSCAPDTSVSDASANIRP